MKIEELRQRVEGIKFERLVYRDHLEVDKLIDGNDSSLLFIQVLAAQICSLEVFPCQNLREDN